MTASEPDPLADGATYEVEIAADGSWLQVGGVRRTAQQLIGQPRFGQVFLKVGDKRLVLWGAP